MIITLAIAPLGPLFDLLRGGWIDPQISSRHYLNNLRATTKR